MASMAARNDSLSSCIKNAVRVFREKIDPENLPSVAVYAPGRVNLIGEHTDYNEGCVLPMALHLVTVVVGRVVSNGTNCRIITTSDVGDNNDVTFSIPAPPTPGEKRITLPIPSWAHYFVGVVSLMSECTPGIPSFETVISTDVPLGGGLSSSAALEMSTCLFVEEICRTVGIALPQRTLEEKALLCQRAEHVFAGAPCGIMDQFVSILADNNKALFIDCKRQMDGRYITENVPLPLEENGLVVLITNSNVKHQVNDGGYKLRTERCHAASEKLNVKFLREIDNIEGLENFTLSKSADNGPSEYQCAQHVVSEIQRTIEAKEVLKSHDFRRFGKLMNDSHMTLRDHFKVSCYELDKLVDLARQDERVYGSCMTGAGFGGCTVTLLEKSAVNDVMKQMKDGYYNEKGEKKEPTFIIASPCMGAGIIADIKTYLQ